MAKKTKSKSHPPVNISDSYVQINVTSDDVKATAANNKGARSRKNIIGKTAAAVGLIASIISILVFFTGKNLPDYEPITASSSALANHSEVSEAVHADNPAYFISLAVSDTMSSNFESAKKIVATASGDTANMTITGESSTGIYGPLNMTMESERRFSFVAVFEIPDEYTVTINAVSQNGDSASEKIIIRS